MPSKRPLVISAGNSQQIAVGDSVECESVLLKGATDAILRSNAGIVEARNAANTALAPIQGSSLSAVGSGGNSVTFSPNFNNGPNTAIELRSTGGLVFQDWTADTTTDYHARLILASSTQFRFSGAGSLAYYFDAPLFIVNNNYFLGGLKISYSTGAPSTPVTGDRWLERDSTLGTPKYGWEWVWNGTYWLSPEKTLTFDALNISASTNRFFPPDSEFNYYFKSLIFSANVTATNDAGNYWGINLIRSTASIATTIYTGGTTAPNTVNSWAAGNRAIINSHVDVTATAAKIFYLSFVKTSAPGTLQAAATLIYQYARK